MGDRPAGVAAAVGVDGGDVGGEGVRAVTETAMFVEQGWTRAVDVPPVRVLFYEGEECTVVRIEHRCRVVEGTQIVCAPALQLGNGHSLVSEDPVTVTPSILCPDCGLHGFITDGVWR